MLALSARWKEPEKAYRRWYRERSGNDFGLRAPVHMPRIGCGLSGGKWGRIEPMVKARLGERGVAVTVYDHA